MPPVLVFDVNETLLDLGVLDPVFERIFGSASARQEWFAEMLKLAFTTTITGNYADFGSCGAAALRALGERHGVPVDADAVRAGMTRLPPHPEVLESLRRLGDAGCRLATLTNSTAEVGERQLRAAGIRSLFEEVLSADAVRRLKPAPEPYRHAAERLGVPVGEVMLIAAHDWDIAGAAAAGCRTAFVARPGKVLSPLAPRPDVVGADIGEVADRILAGP